MTLQIEIPDSLAKQTSELAARQHISVDQVVAAALTAQISAAATRPSVAERVNWRKVDDILARVPNVPPLPGDEL